jgi:putative ABC transport system ATP-binding protein
MSNNHSILRLKDVHYHWSGLNAFGLTIPDFQIKRGETILLLGESGSGKSTLLSLICGTIAPQSGQILVDDVNLATLSNSKRDRFRGDQIGLIFQQFNLLPYASVLDNILLPLRFSPSRKAKVDNPKITAVQLCDALELPHGVIDKQAGTLSVGQQQRVAAARALIGAPPLIIADEPTSALDAATQTVFLELLFNQASANGSTLLMVSHDARLADQFDRVVQIADIVETTKETV